MFFILMSLLSAMVIFEGKNFEGPFFSLSRLLSGRIHSVPLPVILLQLFLLHLVTVRLITSLPFDENLRLNRLKFRRPFFASSAKKMKSCQMPFIAVKLASSARSNLFSVPTVHRRIRYLMSRR